MSKRGKASTSRKGLSNKEEREVYWIFCEGQTEKDYLNKISIRYRRDNDDRVFHLKLDPKINLESKKDIEQKLSSYIGKQGYKYDKSKVSVVTDIDKNPVKYENWQRVKDKINIYPSNSSFEYFLLLHFDGINKNPNDCVKDFMKVIGVERKSEYNSFFETLLDDEKFNEYKNNINTNINQSNNGNSWSDNWTLVWMLMKDFFKY